MKIRHFGLPARPLIGVDPGSTTEGASKATQLSKEAQVLVEGGALTFPRGAAELTQKARTERAKLLLETLRADEGGGFGGKVKGGVDVAASLKSYFRSLEVAELAAHKGAGEAVETFIAELDVPEDIRPLVALSVEGTQSPKPLGKLTEFDNDPNYNRIWAEWQQGNKRVHTVADETVRRWFSVWGTGNDMSSFIGHGDADFKLGVVKFWTRAKEIGQPSVANNIAGYLAQLPQTAEAAKVLLRFAAAYGVDPNTLHLGGKPLAQWGRVAPPRVHGSPVGRDAQFLNNPAAWQQAIARGDVACTKIDDATIRGLAQGGYLADPHSTTYNAPAQVKEGLIHVFARAAELGQNVARDWNAMNNLATYTPASAGAAKAIARYGRAIGMDVSALNLSGQTLGSLLGMKQQSVGGQAGKPLGSISQWEADRKHNNVYAAVQNQPAQARGITDATLQRWFQVWNCNKDLTAYHTTGNAESKVTFVLWWARAKELGLPAQCNPGTIQQLVSAMPDTAEAADALRRLGRAFGFSAEQLLLGGHSPVSKHARRGGSSEGSVLPKREALGDTRMTAAQIAAAIEKQDAKVGALDDASIKRLLEAHPEPSHLLTLSGDRGWQLAILGVLERAVALGAVEQPQVQAAILAVSSRNLDDEVIGARLASLAVRAGVPSSAALAGGQTLATHPGTKRHVEKLERVLEGVSAELKPRRAGAIGEAGGLAAAEPLGDVPGPHTNYWNQHDVRMFQMSDAGLRAEFMNLGDFGWLGHWNNNPAVISLNARVAELNTAAGNQNSVAAQKTRAWLAQPIPEMFGTEDALPRILRAAHAAQVDPANVRVLRGGQPVPLLEHPLLQSMMKGSAADQEARAAALGADLALLSPKSDAHPAQREGAALRLLGVTDPEAEVIHQLDELLPAALAALRDGTLARVDLTKVPAKHRDKLLETAFSRDEHPAQIALLAGVFFKTDAAAIEKLLLAKGHLPAVAQEMAATSAQLMNASAVDLAFTALGATKEPPELASLGWRAWMLTDPAPAQVLARVRKGTDDATALCAAVLERAVLSPRERRDALLQVVQKAIDEELIGKDELVGSLGDEVKQRLDATAMERAESAVQAFLDASPSQVAAARSALAGVLGTATWLDDPNVVATAALKAALAHDLKHVAPLGEVDEAAGSIAGKPWQSRLANQAATVGVAGIQVPLEGKAGELLLPIASEGTGKKNLQALATRWLAKRPVSVVGADAPELISALARATGAALTSVTVTSSTTAHDLLGADGAVSKALASGGVVHLHLDGDAWPEGLGAALMQSASKARLVATGPALPGVPALGLQPLDEVSVRAHVHALGVPEDADAAQKLAQLFVEVRAAAKAGGIGALTEASFTLSLLDRVVARLVPSGPAAGDDGADARLHEALTDLFARRVPAEQREAVQELIDGIVAPPRHTADPLIAVDGKVAVIDELKLAVVGVPAEIASLPSLTSGEHAQLRAAARALELGEPVVADASIAERVGTLYGALTGRDVHVHLLHKDSIANDILGQSAKDTVVVLHDFAAAPEATQDALWEAAAQGRVRLVVGDRDRSISADGLVLREDAVTSEEQAERLGLRARALGLPQAIAEGVLAFKSELDALAASGSVQPLVDLTSAADVDAALELCAQLAGAMGTVDAFVAAMSACWPMSTPEQQQLLEDTARKVADA